MEIQTILQEARLNCAGASLLYPLVCTRNLVFWFALEITSTFYLRLLKLSSGKHQFCRLLDLALAGEVGVICHQGMGHQPKEQVLKELQPSLTAPYSALSYKMLSCSDLPTAAFGTAGNPQCCLLPLLTHPSGRCCGTACLTFRANSGRMNAALWMSEL